MTEGLTIYLLLWLLYFSECFIWVSKRSLALVSPWNGQWRLRLPSSFIAGFKNGAVPLNPWFPGTRAVVGSLSPISISPYGICAFNAQSFFDAGRPVQTPHHFAFDEIASCASQDRSVLINTAPFVECASVAEARQIAGEINQTAQAPELQRQQLIGKFLAARFDQREALDRFAAMSERLRPLEILCSVFFPLLFIGAPLAAFYYGLEEVIIPTAIVMLGFAGAIASIVWSQHKALWPALSHERWASVAKIIFCPPGAIRAVGDLTANFPIACDPLVLSALLPRDEREKFAGAYLRDLQFPIKHGLEGAAQAVVEWYRVELLKQAAAYAKTQTDLRLVALAAAPAFETGCRSYCPRCRSQFTTEAGECPGCDGVSLLQLRAAVLLEPAQATL
jgi:hypothetical protein